MTEQQETYTTKKKTIFRTVKNADNPFVMIDRRPIENESLSWKAKGILAYLLSRPDNWTVQIGDLVKRSTDKAFAIRGAIKELNKAGHLLRREERDEKGRFLRYVFEVYELPFTNSPLIGFPQADNPQAGNLPLNNTDIKQEVLERDNADPVFVALENLTGSLNSNTPRFVDTWRKTHTDKRILQAIGEAKDRKARSVKYVDEILISWEANGYPKTREEKVQARKVKTGQPQPPEEDGFMEELAAKRAALKLEKELRQHAYSG